MRGLMFQPIRALENITHRETFYFRKFMKCENFKTKFRQKFFAKIRMMIFQPNIDKRA